MENEISAEKPLIVGSSTEITKKSYCPFALTIRHNGSSACLKKFAFFC